MANQYSQFFSTISSEPTGAHMLIVSQIKSGSKVLDAGCSSGYFGQYLITEKGCEVWGVEPYEKDCLLAREKGYKKVINKTIESAFEDRDLAVEKFDYIIFADVLEHLVDPAVILNKVRTFLKSDGKIIISLPNVAHYSIRFSLLTGNWNMQEFGILDRTHLHFYTLKTIKELLANANFKIDIVKPRGDLPRWFRKIGLESFGSFLLNCFPEFWALQFVLSVHSDV